MPLSNRTNRKSIKIIGQAPLVIVKKRFGFKTFFSTNTYTAIPEFVTLLEVVSKPQIRFKGKAQADRESAAYMGM
jgi:hypothetical protein